MIRLGQSKLYRRYVSWSHLFELTILFFVDMFLIFSLPLFVCQWELREVISGCDQPHQQHLYRIRIWHRYWPRELWQSKSLPHLLDVILWHYSDTCLIQDLILCGFISLTFFFLTLIGDPDRRCVWRSWISYLCLWWLWKEFLPPGTALHPPYADYVQPWKLQRVARPQQQRKWLDLTEICFVWM